jgi:hypothetical protein
MLSFKITTVGASSALAGVFLVDNEFRTAFLPTDAIRLV